MNNLKRRQELGSFLKTRRSRLSPADLGIECSPHRRVKGLRREEVAELSGVSTIWYTWLEQGRDVQASAQVLESVGQALRLNGYELMHLFTLAGLGSTVSNASSNEHIDSALQLSLDKLDPYPAYVRGPRWDTLAWNSSACMLSGDFSGMNILEKIAYDECLPVRIIPTYCRTGRRWRKTFSPSFESVMADTSVIHGSKNSCKCCCKPV